MALLTLIPMLLDRVRDEDRGATAVEYGLMVALIAVVIIGAVSALGLSLDGIFTETGGCIDNPASCADTTP